MSKQSICLSPLLSIAHITALSIHPTPSLYVEKLSSTKPFFDARKAEDHRAKASGVLGWVVSTCPPIGLSGFPLQKAGQDTPE